jgi:hypothetical protein
MKLSHGTIIHLEAGNARVGRYIRPVSDNTTHIEFAHNWKELEPQALEVVRALGFSEQSDNRICLCPQELAEQALFDSIAVKTITARDAALRAGMNTRTIRYHCERGKIPGAFQTGTGWEIPLESFLDWLEIPRKRGRKPKDAHSEADT